MPKMHVGVYHHREYRQYQLVRAEWKGDVPLDAVDPQ